MTVKFYVVIAGLDPAIHSRRELFFKNT